MKKHLFPALLVTLLFVACGSDKQPVTDQGPDFLAMNIDTTISPGTDFFMYANNGWFSKNPIPASEQGNGLWQLIRDTINAQVRQICENSAANSTAEKGSPKQKIGDMYFSGMDSVSLNAAGVTPLKPEMDMIDGMTDAASVAKATAMVHMNSGAPMFGFYIGQDDKLSNKYAIFISQGGLSMPDRSFYVDMDERAVKVREKFTPYLESMFTIMGYDAAKAKVAAANHMKLETALAKASRKREDTRDPNENYNKITFAELQKMSPSFDWATFMSNTGINNPDTVIVGQPEVIKAWDKLLKSTPSDDLKNYLKIHLLRGLASYLDDNTYQQHFSQDRSLGVWKIQICRWCAMSGA